MSTVSSCPNCGAHLDHDLAHSFIEAIAEDLFGRLEAANPTMEVSVVIDNLGDGLGFKASAVSGEGVIARASATTIVAAFAKVSARTLVALEQAQEEIALDKAAEAAFKAQLRADLADDEDDE